jgi:carbon monoxide dehydrogenase subunit G
MITIQLQKEMQAPPEVVFDLLADHTKFPTWDPHFIEASLTTKGPITKGSKGTTVGEMMGRRVENEIYYDAYDRPRFVSGGTISGTVVAKNSVGFTPTETGTRIDFRLEVEFKGMMRLLEVFVKPVIVKQKQETLDALSDYIAKNYARE